MKRVVTVLLLFLLTGIGCRSPRAIEHRLNTQSPCFTRIEPDQSAHLDRISEANTIDQYVQLCLERNPQISEAFHRVEAIRHRIPQVQSLPDPTLGTTTFLSPVQTAAGEQTFGIGVNQKIVNAERRATRSSIVREELTAAESDLIRIHLELAYQVKSTCFQLLFIRKSIAITDAEIESLDQIADVILRQYEVKASVTQQDVLNVQIEQSKLENDRTKLLDREKTHRARLARLTHLSPDSNLEILDELKISDQELDLESLTSKAIASRPELHAQLANMRRDRKKIHLADLQKKPDFSVGMNWISTSSQGISPLANGQDALSLGIGFNLPIYRNRIRSAVCEAKAISAASNNRYASLRDQITEEVFSLIAKAESQREILDLLQQDIIPKANRTLNLAIDQYTNGDIQYVQLIEDWRSLLRYRLSEARSVTEFNLTLASISRSVGEIDELTDESLAPDRSAFEQ